jgi:hypothetical protein
MEVVARMEVLEGPALRTARDESFEHDAQQPFSSYLR